MREWRQRHVNSALFIGVQLEEVQGICGEGDVCGGALDQAGGVGVRGQEVSLGFLASISKVLEGMGGCPIVSQVGCPHGSIFGSVPEGCRDSDHLDAFQRLWFLATHVLF